MASYVLHTSEHFPIILFSHLPLKFFFLILRKTSHPGTSCIFPKTAPKNEIIPLLGIWEIPFWGNEKPEIQHLQGFHTCSHFPKNIINKYHHVVGHWNLFYTKANTSSPRHRKIRPCIRRCGSYFCPTDYPFPRINTGFLGTYCIESPWSRGILSHGKVDKRKCLLSALYRINCNALRHLGARRQKYGRMA